MSTLSVPNDQPSALIAARVHDIRVAVAKVADAETALRTAGADLHIADVACTEAQQRSAEASAFWRTAVDALKATALNSFLHAKRLNSSVEAELAAKEARRVADEATAAARGTQKLAATAVDEARVRLATALLDLDRLIGIPGPFRRGRIGGRV